jgi:hypothetical protein
MTAKVSLGLDGFMFRPKDRSGRVGNELQFKEVSLLCHDGLGVVGLRVGDESHLCPQMRRHGDGPTSSPDGGLHKGVSFPASEWGSFSPSILSLHCVICSASRPRVFLHYLVVFVSLPDSSSGRRTSHWNHRVGGRPDSAHLTANCRVGLRHRPP